MGKNLVWFFLGGFGWDRCEDGLRIEWELVYVWDFLLGMKAGGLVDEAAVE